MTEIEEFTKLCDKYLEYREKQKYDELEEHCEVMLEEFQKAKSKVELFEILVQKNIFNIVNNLKLGCRRGNEKLHKKLIAKIGNKFRKVQLSTSMQNLLHYFKFDVDEIPYENLWPENIKKMMTELFLSENDDGNVEDDDLDDWIKESDLSPESALMLMMNKVGNDLLLWPKMAEDVKSIKVIRNYRPWLLGSITEDFPEYMSYIFKTEDGDSDEELKIIYDQLRQQLF